MGKRRYLFVVCYTKAERNLQVRLMKFVLKLYPEITIKSKSVRMRCIKLLEGNLRTVLRKVDPHIAVQKSWDRITVVLKGTAIAQKDKVTERLRYIPGIHSFAEVFEHDFVDLEQAFLITKDVYQDALVDKTFCVRVKRKGQHSFSSTDMERYIGGGLNQYTQARGVSLSSPELTIKLELQEDKLFIVHQEQRGLGGFPIASQEDVLSLMSGGYDSGVASFEMISKGCRTHYCFFNLGGPAHETGVKQAAYYLWQKYGESHKVRFISVPFEPVVEEILERIDQGMMGVVLKRMMIRIASEIADRFQIQGLVTGESLGQVSSQTLTNLNVIDRATSNLILRPLVATDKQVIIDKAKEIGTAQFADTMPEYCGVISQKPTIKAVLSRVEEEEQKFSEDLIERVLAQTVMQDIREIADEADKKVGEAVAVSQLEAENMVVLDIRAPEEHESRPLQLDDLDVKHVPFYKLRRYFSSVDHSRQYALYCDRGVMSQLQALYLQEQGHTNVKVLHLP